MSDSPGCDVEPASPEPSLEPSSPEPSPEKSAEGSDDSSTEPSQESGDASGIEPSVAEPSPEQSAEGSDDSSTGPSQESDDESSTVPSQEPEAGSAAVVQHTAASDGQADYKRSSDTSSSTTGSFSEVDIPTPATTDSAAVVVSAAAAAAVSATDVADVSEQIETQACSLAEHVAKHDFPKYVSACGSCKFGKHRLA